MNDVCFEKCIPKPGSSVSSGEQSCFTSCMEVSLKPGVPIYLRMDTRCSTYTY
jgi:hypothetical protein